MSSQSFQMPPQFEERDGVWLLRGVLWDEDRSQKELWDEIGQNYYDRARFEEKPPENYVDAIGRPGGLWNELPIDRAFDSILELGCGDGRASIHLSKSRGLDCYHYCGMDISEPQLRRLQVFKRAYDFYPSAKFTLVCTPAREIPLPDSSVDLVISDAVFMHLDQDSLKILMQEVQRVLKPDGRIGFRNSFHNSQCIAHLLRNTLRSLSPNSNPIYSNQYSIKEVRQLLRDSGLEHDGRKITIRSDGQLIVFPEQLGSRRIPPATWLNNWVRKNKIEKKWFIYSFDAYSW